MIKAAQRVCIFAPSETTLRSALRSLSQRVVGPRSIEPTDLLSAAAASEPASLDTAGSVETPPHLVCNSGVWRIDAKCSR
jgi:hypothetical protein